MVAVFLSFQICYGRPPSYLNSKKREGAPNPAMCIPLLSSCTKSTEEKGPMEIVHQTLKVGVHNKLHLLFKWLNINNILVNELRMNIYNTTVYSTCTSRLSLKIQVLITLQKPNYLYINTFILEIIARIRDPTHEVFRPRLAELDTTPKFVTEVIKECWAQDPEKRPDFKTIRSKLKELQRGM